MPLLPNTQFLIHRDDLNHTTVSGNKLHKLTPNLEYAQHNGQQTILSFGGPFSNHLHALAYTCHKAGLQSIGAIRGELHRELTPTLKDCQAWGMKLIAVTRASYRAYQEYLANKESATYNINAQFPELIEHIKTPQTTLIIPEGGSNRLAITALAKAYAPLFQLPEYEGITHAVCASGTGATVAGLSLAAPSHVSTIGVQAVAEGDATLNRIKTWFGDAPKKLSIVPGHLGGFAKVNDNLKHFMQEFEYQRGIPLDPVYNAKCFYKLSQMYAEKFFSPKDKVLVIHTGGLQGNRGLNS